MKVVRLSVVLLSVLICLWFGLGVRQAHDLARATAIVTASERPTPDQAAQAASLLQAASTLNPDFQVELVRAQLASRQGDSRRAIALAEQVARAEPRSEVAWDQLARLSSGNGQALVKALHKLRELSPPVPGAR